ncbi:MAG TPA: glycosyltransferase [Thermoleophilaceae bacterium]|nr:glycosyltransferase [Thermoleophilaceae bacterium]
MKLAYVVSRYPFVSHVFILREVLALRRAGVEVETFTIRRSGAEHVLSADDREAAATTHAIVPPRPLDLLAAHMTALATGPGRYASTLALALRLRGRGARALLWQVFYFGEAALMWRACRRMGIRHVHAHHANVASDVALLAARLGGAGWSWSFTMHGSTEFFDVREHRLQQKVELASFVVCVSHHGRSQLMRLVDTSHWDKLRVVRCGVDVTAFAPGERDEREAPLEVLTVGRVDPVKGQPLLIEAVAELRRRGVDARLTFVGDGPGLAELTALADRLGVADRVEFPGAVGQDEIRAYYRRAGAFALPSFAEGLPVVLIEAMACGLPVVASRITGIPELVEDGVSGLLITPARGDELADALGALAADPALRAEMGRAGRAKVVAEFDIERTTADLLAVFTEYVGGAQP